MDSDEDFARKLQEQFDAEFRAMEEQTRRDAAVAQHLASSSHKISDSEEEVLEERKELEQMQMEGRKMRDEEGPECSRVEEDGVQDSADEKKKLPLCKYGSQCYRRNPQHLQEFHHPHLENAATSSTSGAVKRSCSELSNSEASKKRSRTSPPQKEYRKLNAKLSFTSRLLASAPFNFFLNKIYSVERTKDDPLTLVLPDLLNPQMGDIIESVQLNFMVDLVFLMDNYKAAGLCGRPLLVMYGDLDGNPQDYPGLVCTKVNIPFRYGTHHTKMMILKYKDGLRVVIHTANLTADDWYEKTQGFWVSPFFPELGNGKSSILEGESGTHFKRDLVEYLQSYKTPDLTRWSHLIKSYDFSACNVVLICSVPGYHVGDSRHRWGHMKVRQTLHQHCSPLPSSAPIIAQCSSIGSLGKDARSWLSGELGLSFAGALSGSPPVVHVIYPSEDDVCNSSQGWMGGSCLPYQSGVHDRQTWLSSHLHVWLSEKRKRTRAMPHIKTYTRINKSQTSAQFLLLTSANLSKAAWGALQKQNSQLFIRSYEVGVLLLPKFVACPRLKKIVW